MARIYTEGFEMGDGLFWTNTNEGTINTTYKRSGNYSWRLGSNLEAYRNITGLSSFYARIGYRPESGFSQDGTYILIWRNGTTVHGSVRLSDAGVLIAYRSTTLVATGSIPVARDVWSLIEVYVLIDDTVGRIITKVDGITDIDFTGDTRNGTSTTADNIGYGGNAAEFDDLALNSTAGGSDNSWIGDGHVIALFPNAAGDSSQWTPSSGATNYLMVDETPADNDTTYVYTSGINNKDLYHVANAVLSGTTIHRVWVEARARDTVAISGAIRLMIKENATESESTDLYVLNNYTTRLVGSEYATKPSNSQPWTDTDINDLQIGQKLTVLGG